MRERTRLLLLAGLMTIIAVSGVLISGCVLYDAAFDEESDRLRELAQGRARIIESGAQHALDLGFRLEFASEGDGQ